MCDVENERGKGLTKSKVRRQNFLTKYISPINYKNLRFGSVTPERIGQNFTLFLTLLASYKWRKTWNCNCNFQYGTILWLKTNLKILPNCKFIVNSSSFLRYGIPYVLRVIIEIVQNDIGHQVKSYNKLQNFLDFT